MEKLHQTQQPLVKKSFKDTGISVSPDGSEDAKIRIKCLITIALPPDINNFQQSTNNAALASLEIDPSEDDFSRLVNIDYNKLTVKKLRLWCAAKGVKVTSNMRKAMIINALEEKDQELLLSEELDDAEMLPEDEEEDDE
jgi:hypothetical protein